MKILEHCFRLQLNVVSVQQFSETMMILSASDTTLFLFYSYQVIDCTYFHVTKFNWNFSEIYFFAITFFQLGGIHSRQMPTNIDGTFDIDAIDSYIRPRTDPHQPFTALIGVENTHNNCGGKVLPLKFLKKVDLMN